MGRQKEKRNKKNHYEAKELEVQSTSERTGQPVMWEDVGAGECTGGCYLRPLTF